MALVENNPEKKHGEGNKPEEGAMKKVGDQSSVTNTARAGQVEADQADEKAAAEAKAEAARTVLELTEKARVERKRNREKQRRSEVTKGLEALMEQIFIIDPKLRLDAEERAANTSGGRMPTSEASLLSRVELVNIAVGTMKRIHEENEERKRIISGMLANGRTPTPSVLPSLRELQTRQELQQRLNLEALLGNSSGASGIQRTLRESLAPPQTASLGGLLASRHGAASLAHPTTSGLSLGAASGPSAAASLLGASSLPPGLADQGLSALSSCDDPRESRNSALYQLLLNRRIQDEETAALVAAGLLPIGQGAMSGLGYLDSRDPGASVLPSSQRIAGGSIREAAMQGQTIAEAAAARSAFANGEEPASKRLKGRLA